MTTKYDAKKQLKHLYRPRPGALDEVSFPVMQFLMIDGTGNPRGGERFAAAIGALYGLAYTIKFTLKAGAAPFDFVVMPLESQWWADDLSAFPEERYDEWKWTLMIMMPERINQEIVDAARQSLAEKKNPPLLDEVRLETMENGEAVQMLHVGPYDEVGETASNVLQHIDEQGWTPRGKYHEVYLSDPRRTAPEKLKTVCRMPFSRECSG